MRSPPPSLGLGWPEDVPWRQKEPRTHVVPLAGAAALCPGHAPLPRASGGPGDIPLGWLRALRYLSKRWLRTGRWELLPGEAGRLFAREPGSQKEQTWAGCVVGGSLLLSSSCWRKPLPPPGPRWSSARRPSLARGGTHFLAWVLSVPPGSCVLSSEAS